MKGLARFLFEAGMLKKMRRSGYPFLGSGGESVADHCFRAALLGYMLPFSQEGVDAPRVALMLMHHDLAEARSGDITPRDGVPHDEKLRREREGLAGLLRLLGPGSDARERMERCWEEVAEGSTPEARFVCELDVLERSLQALEYQRGGRTSHSLESFGEGVAFSFSSLQRIWDQARDGSDVGEGTDI